MAPFPSEVVARYNSYTSVIHQEKVHSPVQQNLSSLVQCLVEWLVVLQRLEEERKMYPVSVSCRCSKAVKINEELKSLGRSLTNVAMLEERLGPETVTSHDQMDTAGQHMVSLAALLRADVSILIPSAVGRAEPGVAETARSIVGDTDNVVSLVRDTVESVTGLVYSLLGVDCCQHCSGSDDNTMEDQEIDPDIMNMVAAMCGDYSDMDSDHKDESSKADLEIGRQCLERSRKRKQSRPNKFPITNVVAAQGQATKNGLGSPNKKVRKIGDSIAHENRNPTEILFLLEKKKKLVKKDGLYKFVLWREALRDEKNKVCVS